MLVISLQTIITLLIVKQYHITKEIIETLNNK